MKTILMFVAAASALSTITSCGQCTECTKIHEETQKLCKKDYGSDDSYNAAYKYVISQGYKCD